MASAPWRILALVALLAAAACAPAAAGGAALCRIETEPGPLALVVGEPADVALRVRLVPGAALSPGAPFRVTLAAEGLTLERSELSLSDAAPRPDGVELPVRVVALRSGPALLRSRWELWVCTERSCERQERVITTSFTARRGHEDRQPP